MLTRRFLQSLGLSLLSLATLTASLPTLPVQEERIDTGLQGTGRPFSGGTDDELPPKERGLGKDPSWLLPDLQTLPPHNLLLLVSGGGRRKVLRFANTVWNSGPGPFELRSWGNRPSDSADVAQIIYRINGASAGRIMGELEFHPEHDHWHWDNFATYQVWSLDSQGAPGRLLATSGKVSYCSLDHRRIEAFLDNTVQAEGKFGPERARYGGCGWRLQGISVGWTDTYRRDLPGQDIDISHLPDGVYILLSTVNPRGLLLEADLENNTGQVYFELVGDRLTVLQ